ncbi:FHA domain-containing protein [Planctomycetota bacterium]
MERLALRGKGEASWPLAQLPILIGRHGADCLAVELADNQVSRCHAEIYRDTAGRLLVRDLGSRNGTYLNGRRISREEPLQLGDVVMIGSTELRVVRVRTLDETGPGGRLRLRHDGGAAQAVSYEALARSLAEEARAAARAGNRHHAQTGLLYQLGRCVAGLRDPEEIVDAVTGIAAELLGVEAVGVYEPTAAGELHRMAGSPGGSAEALDPGRAAELFISRVLRHQEAAIYDARTSGAADPLSASMKELSVRSAAAVPLCVGDGCIGVLYADSRVEEHPLDTFALELLGAIALQAAASLEAARQHQEAVDARHKLGKANVRLRSWNTELERRVEERTRETERQKEEIGELLQDKTDLLRMAAHDLRSPLQSLMVHVEFCKEELRLGNAEAAEKALEQVQTTVQRTAFFLDDLLTAEAIRSGRLEVQPRLVDVQVLLHRTLSNMSVQAAERGVTLHVETEQGLDLVQLDPDRVTQVLDNLVENAIRAFLGPGRIVLRGCRRSTELALEVCDNGPGLDEECRRWLESSRHVLPLHGRGGRTQGFGLGLAIASKLTALIRGRLEVAQSSEAGTTLVLLIPDAFGDPRATENNGAARAERIGVQSPKLFSDGA